MNDKPVSQQSTRSQAIKLSSAIAIVLMLITSACASPDGLYEPACIAYEGDRVQLREARFEWQKFTDQRNIDAQGNVVDSFPGYPKTGSIVVTQGRVEFQADDKASIEDHFIVEHLGNRYLLAEDQHQSFIVDGVLQNCVLKLVDDER